MKVKITNKMKTGERRLHLIANLLDSDFFPDKRFNMGHWGLTDDAAAFWKRKAKTLSPLRDVELEDDDALLNYLEIPLANVCGTQACALGHATTIPELYKAGLRLVIDVKNRNAPYDTVADIILLQKRRRFTDNIDDIGMAVFGINGDRTSTIFFGEGRSSTDEAQVIRDEIKSILAHEGFKKTTC